jgi:hypothetical protein
MALCSCGIAAVVLLTLTMSNNYSMTKRTKVYTLSDSEDEGDIADG